MVTDNDLKALRSWSLRGLALKPQVSARLDFTRFFLVEGAENLTPKKSSIFIANISKVEINKNEKSNIASAKLNSSIIEDVDFQTRLKCDFLEWGSIEIVGLSFDIVFFDYVCDKEIFIERGNL